MPNVGAVFIWSDTRLWGHSEQQRYLLFKFKTAGVRNFDSYGKEWKDDTPMEKLTNMFSAGLSEYETGMTSKRISDLFESRAADGEILQKPPFGMKVIKKLDQDGEALVSEWLIDEPAMAIVRRIFKEYSEGVGFYEIAMRLQAERIKTPKGLKNWSPSNIRRTLDNQFYIGVVIYNRTTTIWEIDQITGDKLRRVAHRPEEEWIISDSPHGCILADDPFNSDSVAHALWLFERCQEKRNSVGRERSARIYDNRPMDGLIICDRCTQKMQARRVGNKLASGERAKTFDYRCPHRANFGSGCSSSHTMMENKLFRLIRNELTAQLEDESTNLVEVIPQQTARRNVNLLEQTVARAQAAVDKVHETNEEGGYRTPAVFASRIEIVETKLEIAEAELAEVRNSVDMTPAHKLSGERIHELLELLDLLADDSIDIDLRRRAAANLIRDIRVNNPRVKVRLNVAA
jgi:DNA invertase Pin-like site-specific DNA recombinase